MAKGSSVRPSGGLFHTPPRSASADFAPRAARVLTGVVIIGFFLIALSYAVSGKQTGLGLVVFVLLLCVLLTLQACHSFPELIPRLVPHRRVTLALQVLLTYLPFLYYGNAWLGMQGFLAASVLLILPGMAGRISLGIVVALAGPIQFAVGYGLGMLAYNVIAVILTGFIVAGLSRMSGLVTELHLARAELAQAAIAEERSRFARDLHDLLGYSLSTITLKCEVAYRMVPRQPEQAQEELTEVLQIARQALADVRVVASGYRAMSLRAEALAVQAMLTSVGIGAKVSMPAELELPPEVDTVLATVLREGVTNMLRHSRAQQCLMSVETSGDWAELEIRNDGLGDFAGVPRPLTSGTGIGNLTSRLAELGGRLGVDTGEGDWFVLRAAVPVAAP